MFPNLAQWELPGILVNSRFLASMNWGAQGLVEGRKGSALCVAYDSGFFHMDMDPSYQLQIHQNLQEPVYWTVQVCLMIRLAEVMLGLPGKTIRSLCTCTAVHPQNCSSQGTLEVTPSPCDDAIVLVVFTVHTSPATLFNIAFCQICTNTVIPTVLSHLCCLLCLHYIALFRNN